MNEKNLMEYEVSDFKQNEWRRILGNQELLIEKYRSGYNASAIVNGSYGTAAEYAAVPGFQPGYERMISVTTNGKQTFTFGEHSVAAATSNNSLSETRGKYSVAATTGCRAHAKCGEHSVAASIGPTRDCFGEILPPCSVQGGIGSILILRSITGGELKVAIVDGKKILPDTPYVLNSDDEFVPCGEAEEILDKYDKHEIE